MTGVSFTRGGYHRIGQQRHQRPGRLHRAPGRPLDLRRDRPRLRRRARRGDDDRRVRVRRVHLHLPRRAAVPDAARTARRRRSRSSAPARPSTSPGVGAPPASARRAERARVHRPGCSAPVSPRPWSGSATAMPCSAPTPTTPAPPSSPRGSTDWAHGLAGRDPHIEQITRNVLERLGRLALNWQRCSNWQPRQQKPAATAASSARGQPAVWSAARRSSRARSAALRVMAAARPELRRRLGVAAELRQEVAAHARGGGRSRRAPGGRRAARRAPGRRPGRRAMPRATARLSCTTRRSGAAARAS